MLFIDTGAFIAKYLKDDQFHKEALRIWEKIEEKSTKIVTSNFVVDETLTLLARRSNYEFSAEVGEVIYSSGIINIFRPTSETESNALLFFKKFSDQKVSFTDCISFQLMKEHSMKTVFTFDHHFELAGFFCVS